MDREAHSAGPGPADTSLPSEAAAATNRAKLPILCYTGGLPSVIARQDSEMVSEFQLATRKVYLNRRVVEQDKHAQGGNRVRIRSFDETSGMN